LKEERNALQKQVFPKLQELCMQNGCRFQAIDLRWGVREEASFDQQTLKICIEEIKRCQKTQLKPNFIVLLGNRYGWRPAPPQIPQDEFEKIRALLPPEDIVQLDKWYLLDNNAIPAEYILQPRTGEYRKQENWALVEQQLRIILLKAVVKLQFSENDLVKYFASATEQEIIQGFDDPEAEKHVFCFFRELEGIEQNPVKDLIETDLQTGKIDHEANRRLHILKDKLQARLGNNCFEYQASLTSEGITKDYIDNLCKAVYDSLASVIREEIKHISEVDPLDKEIDDHATFGQARAKFFVGRETVLRKIEDYLRNNCRQPLVVFGESGSGKTALMAHELQESRKTFPQAEVIFRFIGATPASFDGRSLLESLCHQIARRYGADESTVPTEYPKLAAEFSERLKLASPDKPLTILLDALDQISSTDNARNLSWMPSVLPENVHIVVSCLPGECLSILEGKLPHCNFVPVEGMSRDEGTFLLNKWLSQEGRCLQPDQAKEVLDKFAACGLPLYLKLEFEEACLWKSYTERKTLSPTIPGIILDMFNRLSSNENYGEKMFSHSLGYLAAAKNGLTEDELLDVLSLDAEVFDDFKKSSFHELTGDRLPVVIWSRLQSDLDPYLTEHSADGTSLLAFYHLQLKQMVEKVYLSGHKRSERHNILSSYFSGQPSLITGGRCNRVNIRKTEELPWQCTMLKQWNQLSKVLCDLDLFRYTMENRQEYEWIRYWLPIKKDFKPADCYESAIEVVWKQQGESQSIAGLLYFASRLLQLMGEYDSAIVFQKRVIDILQKNRDPSDKILAEQIDNLASLYLQIGDYKKAEEMNAHALSLGKKTIETDSAELAIYYSNRAVIFKERGKASEAIPIAERALHITESEKGLTHPDVALMLSNLSTLYYDVGDFTKALPLAVRALEIEENTKGHNHPDVGECLNNLAFCYMSTNNYVEAISHFKLALSITEKTFGHEHPNAGDILSNIGLCYQLEGDYKKAIVFLQEALSIQKMNFGEMHPRVAYILFSMAYDLFMLHQSREAIDHCKHAVEIAQKIFGPQHPKTLMYIERLRSLEGR
jgi:tetratricopeptide (TPR) repeat protein